MIRLAGWWRRVLAGVAPAGGRAAPGMDAPLVDQRFVVADVESSGLDPFHHRLISIGAIAVEGGVARLGASFETVLRQERPSDNENILVHRIGGSRQLEGREPAAALNDFLAFAGGSPLVAYHADFDRILIERAAQAALGTPPRFDWLDLALIAPALFPAHSAASTLDEWLALFGIENYDRHDAVADAVATAQLLLVMLAEARRQGIDSCAGLMRLERDQRWLGRS